VHRKRIFKYNQQDTTLHNFYLFTMHVY